MIKDSGCDSSGKPKLLQPKHVSVQTDEVKDEEHLLTGAGGSGIIRVCILLDCILYCCILSIPKIKNFLKYVIKTSFGIMICPAHFSLFRPLLGSTRVSSADLSLFNILQMLPDLCNSYILEHPAQVTLCMS
jgi:hypothetical protein